jgi:hypothetical protein
MRSSQGTGWARSDRMASLLPVARLIVTPSWRTHRGRHLQSADNCCSVRMNRPVAPRGRSCWPDALRRHISSVNSGLTVGHRCLHGRVPTR